SFFFLSFSFYSFIMPPDRSTRRLPLPRPYPEPPALDPSVSSPSNNTTDRTNTVSKK
ncbi:hypothetical protein AB4K20DRAFT_1289122, partial [Rhizopus microsporus]